MPHLVKIAQLCDIPPGGRIVVAVDDVEIAVFNVDNEQLYAVEDICSHDGGPLSEGALLEGVQVECPRHGARFDIRTGRALTMPAFEPIASFPVVVRGDDVFLNME